MIPNFGSRIKAFDDLQGSQSRLGRGPGVKSPQTRIWLRGETNADGIASGEVKPEGPGGVGNPCTTAPA